MSTTDLHDKLKSLIETNAHTEKDCRAFLKHARSLLINFTSETFVEDAEEYRGNAGDSDYLIVTRTKNEAGIEKNVAYLWEAKAPQLALFEADTNNRVRPTKDFISAENQLLHYYDDSVGSEQFRKRFGLVGTDDVKMGGLIIGCQKTLVHGGDYKERDRMMLYNRALEVRKNYLYRALGIKVLLWDFHILAHLKPLQPVTPPLQSGAQAPISIQSFKGTIVSSS
jgi:hypothetical protein